MVLEGSVSQIREEVGLGSIEKVLEGFVSTDQRSTRRGRTRK